MYLLSFLIFIQRAKTKGDLMKQFNRPIRKNYPTTFSYNVDLFFYYLKKNKVAVISIFSFILLVLIGLFAYSLVVQNAENKSLVLLETVYDDITMYIDKYGTIGDKRVLREKIDPALNKIIKKYPYTKEATRAYYYLGLMDYLDGNYQKSIDNLMKIRGKNSHFNSNVYFGIVQSYINLGKIDEAEKYALIMYKKYKKEVFGALACYMLGRIYEMNNNIDKALEYYHKIEKDYASSYLAMDKKIKNSILLLELEAQKSSSIK
jgi:tetratricopeptide (TPR) repeat protein